MLEVVVEVVGKGSEEAQACLLPHDIFENKIRMKSFRITECSIFFNLIILVQQPHNLTTTSHRLENVF